MTFHPGDDVIVEFDGMDHAGEVLWQSRGWVTCTVHIDSSADYGRITPQLAPRSTVCVQEKKVRHADTTSG